MVRLSDSTPLGGARATKNPQQHPARAGWRKFGEYAFLEDSRYASQQKNMRREQLADLGRAAWATVQRRLSAGTRWRRTRQIGRASCREGGKIEEEGI